MLCKAKNLKEIPNAFQSGPLPLPELRGFYFDRTMPVRTDDPIDDPIDEIFLACTTPPTPDRPAYKPVLLVGNRGCGKSTELNSLSNRLKEAGCHVHTASCRYDLEAAPECADLLILIADALVTISDKVGYEPEASAERTLNDFWSEREDTTTVQTDKSAKMGLGISGDVSGSMEAERTVRPAFRASEKLSLKGILESFIKLRAEYGVSEDCRQVYRKRVKQRLSDWMSAMNSIADGLTAKLDGKPPVIIFEELDKLHSPGVWKVFYQDGFRLTGFHFPVIYTFPSAFAIDRRYAALRDDFKCVRFYMIQVTDADGKPYEPGIEAILEIMKLRADLSLFEDGVPRLLIDKTGGSLRELFAVICDAFQRANRRGASRIEAEDAQWALRRARNEFKDEIDAAQFDFLRKMHTDHRYREQIGDRALTVDLLDKRILLEHNGWRSVHPLVVDFLKEQGALTDD